MLALSSGSTIIWALYFLLCGAKTAAVLVFIAGGRIALSTFAVGWTQSLRLWVTAAFVALVAGCAWLTWDGAASVPSTIASVFLAIATLNFKIDKLRYALLLGDLLWLWNGLAVGSTLGAVAAMLGLLVNTIVLLRGSAWRVRMQFTRAPVPHGR